MACSSGFVAEGCLPSFRLFYSLHRYSLGSKMWFRYHARRGLSCSCEPYDRYRISEGEDLCRLLVGYLGSHLLIHLLRCLAVVHRGHRYLVCHGVCGHGGEEGWQASRLVRPHLGISARLQKICLRFGKILVQAEVTGIDIVNAIYNIDIVNAIYNKV